jgi:CrcB protein
MSLIPVSEKTAFPLVTLLINILGAFLIGLLAELAARYEGINPDLMTFLRVGICGGFTTFSSFALEVTTLAGSGRTWMSVAYMVASMVFGVAAVWMGRAIIQ